VLELAARVGLVADDRFAASGRSGQELERTEVESSSTRSSWKPGLSQANTPQSQSIVSLRRRLRLWYRLFGQLREQVQQPLSGHRQEATVAGDAHDRLGDTKADDLRVCDPSAGVSGLSGKRSSAVQKTAVRSRSRSACTVASRSTVN
jgi:hypothetical protein